ncbi:MAG: ATP-binding protein [Smithellaceae bacterium]|jgi:predicted kinase
MMTTSAEQPTIHMLCGLICSGKTTLARKLEKDFNAVAFSPDEWMAQLFGSEHTDQYGFKYAPKVHALVCKIYERLLQLNVDVILDSGFWSKFERDQVRRKAVELGVKHKLYFLDCSKDICMQRLRERNTQRRPDAIVIPENKFLQSLNLFQPPGADEEFEHIETG